MKNSIPVVIRVGEKNNFNQTEEEFQALKKFEGKGDIFVNSNGFTPIDSRLPSIVTINPYMEFVPLKGDLSNVKAVRIKVFATSSNYYTKEQEKCVEFCVKNNLPMLLTYMRYRSKATTTQFTGYDYKLWYKWEKNYFRPTPETKKNLLSFVRGVVLANYGDVSLINECDSNGGGCPDCGNCHRLTFGYEVAEIKALNLSVSGIKDKNGRRGLCQFKCPDCFAKIVTFGKRPACDKLITNKKITGEIKHA